MCVCKELAPLLNNGQADSWWLWWLPQGLPQPAPSLSRRAPLPSASGQYVKCSCGCSQDWLMTSCSFPVKGAQLTYRGLKTCPRVRSPLRFQGPL